MNNNAVSIAGQQPGMRLRGAVKTAIFNSAVSDFNVGCVRIADVNGDDSLIVDSNIELVNVLRDCMAGFYNRRAPDVEENVDELVLTYSATLAIQQSAAQLTAAPVINAINNGSGFVFDQTNFVGAVDPNGIAWWQGWTLTIRPGVHVRAFDTGSLIVTRGSKLMAEGKASQPITFSSLADDDFDGLGEWGGVVIQGFAPQYGTGSTIVGNYGGNDPADNSGSLRYVRIAEGGLVAGPNNEINGPTLQGVGHGTTIEYIQYAIVRKDPNKSGPTGSNDPRGIEANSSDADFVPETDAVLANILILGSAVNNSTTSSAGEQPAMRLRRAVKVTIYNTAVRGFNTGCIRIDDADTNGDTVVDRFSDVTLVNVLGECTPSAFYNKRVADTGINAVANTVTVDAAYALTDARATVTAGTITAMDNDSGFTFDSNTYVGAVEPGTAAGDARWSGWIIEGSFD